MLDYRASIRPFPPHRHFIVTGNYTHFTPLTDHRKINALSPQHTRCLWTSMMMPLGEKEDEEESIINFFSLCHDHSQSPRTSAPKASDKKIQESLLSLDCYTTQQQRFLGFLNIIHLGFYLS